MSSLGYRTSSHQMRDRLQLILADEDYLTLVACDGEHVVGFLGARVGLFYEDDGHYGQLMALAVAPDSQRRGTGRMLVQSAESALIERGVRVVVVTSGNQRAGAHAFYESSGYEFTGRRYTKSVASAA
jgi:ribosomal protein S18 acetylase RimI-like enzyme